MDLVDCLVGCCSPFPKPHMRRQCATGSVPGDAPAYVTALSGQKAAIIGPVLFSGWSPGVCFLNSGMTGLARPGNSTGHDLVFGDSATGPD